VTKFSFATKTGFLASNPGKVNQDSYITVPHFCGKKFAHFFGVCDGHGQNGHDVSGQLKTRLPSKISSLIIKNS
jgi:serine/threonine protein phosphatase PrpC